MIISPYSFLFLLITDILYVYNIKRKDVSVMPSSTKLVSQVCTKCGKSYDIKYSTTVERGRRGIPSICHECMAKHRSENMKSYYKNMDNAKKEEINKKKSESGKSYWNSLDDKSKKKRSDSIKSSIEKLSEEELKLRMEKLAEGNKNYWNKLSKDDREKLKEKRLTNLNLHNQKMVSDDDYRNNISDKISKSKIVYWSKLSDDEKRLALNNLISGHSKWLSNLTQEERDAISVKTRETWSSLSDDEIIKLSERMRNTSINMWAALTPDEKNAKIKKIIQLSGNTSNNFHKKFESYFKDSYISGMFYTESEVLSTNEGSHHWDYGIYDKSTNELVMLVDLDGAYFHADICDYSGVRSHEEYDESRFLSVPDRIKYHIIYENSFVKSFDLMIRSLMLNFDEFINDQMMLCRNMGFPYPRYTDSELKSSWDQLCKLDLNSKYTKLSVRNREGDRLITHFHPSIYHAHVKGKPSPYDAWFNDDLLRKCIENRVIYVNSLNPNKILQGFNISKIAPKVSVFSAGRAKILIDKYLSEFDTIFDPFSGFGGRMLGALSLGKQYIGRDISDNHIKENMDIVKFLGVEEYVDLAVKDIFDDNGVYEALFTCPPYGTKELWSSEKIFLNCDKWILECMKRFKCKKYLFVVDDTEVYKRYIVDEIENKSHFGKNKEYVIEIQ